MMFASIALALIWACAALADVPYVFTMDVTTSRPVPGKPFTFTWTGGEPTSAVYIVLENYFELVPDQNIPYGPKDVILSSAPNNGSWTYNVPLNIRAGRHSFGIGPNPILQSDSTPIFLIDSSETSAVAPGPAPTTTESFTPYNGCGLPPVPGYTYTGYQPPCARTSNGVLTTLYPLVPASIKTLWNTLGSLPAETFTPKSFSSKTSTPSTPTSTSSNRNTAFATGIFAQALQCQVQVTPSRTSLVASSTTTVFSLVGCSTRRELFSTPVSGFVGTCHESGYTTFPVSGTSSACCPSQWATTNLVANLYCFTRIGVVGRAIDDEVGGSGTISGGVTSIGLGITSDLAGGTSLVRLEGVVFTRAGVVVGKAQETGTGVTATTGSTTNGTGGVTAAVSSSTSSSANTTTSTNDVVRLNVGVWGMFGLVAGIFMLM